MEVMVNYNLHEVAEILNCSYMTVYNLVKKGEIKYFKVGVEYRVKESELNNYINRGE